MKGVPSQDSRTADLKAVAFGDQVQFVEKSGNVVLLVKALRK